jgi:hypothetical protein
MGNSGYKTERARILGEVSTALFDLRDALTELSLALKDWQFETDLARRKNIEETVQQLLHRITTAQGPASSRR